MKKLKHTKILYLTIFFLIAPYQIFKNNMILINGSLFSREKDSLQRDDIEF